jgi:hypothetical protein
MRTFRYMDAFAELGDEWLVPSALRDTLECFFCELYGHGSSTNIDDVRYEKLVDKVKSLGDKLKERVEKGERSGIAWERLPIARVNLNEHIRQANYQLAIWKRAHVHITAPPPPQDGHGCVLHIFMLHLSICCHNAMLVSLPSE